MRSVIGRYQQHSLHRGRSRIPLQTCNGLADRVILTPGPSTYGDSVLPTRYLKPGIRDSESIDSLSPMAECLFYRLLVTVDDFGRYDGRPAMVRAHCFPIKAISNDQCSALLDELVSSGLVSAYVVEGKPFLQVSKWDNVPRAKESKFPASLDGCIHMYTDARIPSAVLPVTVTETETETETETGTENRKQAPRKRVGVVEQPPDVGDQVWTDFVAMRKAKGSAITQTGLDGIKTEASKAGWTLEAALRECCSRGWRGFKAEWIGKDSGGASGSRQPQQMYARGGIPIHPSWFQSTGSVIDMEGVE